MIFQSGNRLTQTPDNDWLEKAVDLSADLQAKKAKLNLALFCVTKMVLLIKITRNAVTTLQQSIEPTEDNSLCVPLM